MNYRMILAAALLGSSALLAGCGDKPDAAKAQPVQSAGEQQEIQKYNLYVDVANKLTTPFQQAHETYVSNQVPLLKGNAPLTSLNIENDILIDQSTKKLDAALAIDAPIAEIDGAAKDFSAALKKLSPLSHELNNYAGSKGYLADNGDKARELSANYLAALTAVAQAEGAFFDGLGARDQALVKKAFDEAPKDTAAYYRAGLIYYGKINHTDANALFEAPNDPKALDAFEKSLALAADAATGWGKKVAEKSAESGKTCNGGMLEINEFIGKSRSIVKDVKDGVYKREAAERNPIPGLKRRTSLMDATNRYNQNYSNMVNRFNFPTC